MRENSQKGWVAILRDTEYILNQSSLRGVVSSVGRILGSGNQGVEVGILPLKSTLSDFQRLALSDTAVLLGQPVLLPLVAGHTTRGPACHSLRELQTLKRQSNFLRPRRQTRCAPSSSKSLVGEKI